jgi:hypothetical protein
LQVRRTVEHPIEFFFGFFPNGWIGRNGIFSGSAVGVMKTRSPLAEMDSKRGVPTMWR